MTRPFDPSRRFIRIVEQRPDGMVEFEFAVGEPELFVEMLLPREAFDELCAMHGVTPVHQAATGHVPQEQGWEWTLRDARTRRLQP